MRLLTIAVAAFATVALSRPADACAPTLDTYLSTTTTNPDHTNQCNWSGGVCTISLKGIKYAAPGTNPPVIIYNHGSGQAVKADGLASNSCFIADYFVPLGYTVYVPVRRGHYAQFGTTKYYSTGKFIDDAYDGQATHDELLRQKFDVQDAVKHVKSWNTSITASKFVLMGNSYGGMVTLYSNALNMGQKAVVIFSPGGISWMGDGDDTVDSDGDGDKTNDNDTPNTYLQNQLKREVVRGNSAPFFLQAQWDHDTRPTTELSYTYANSSIMGGPTNGRPFQAAIYDFGLENADDPQTVHEDFPKNPALWGPAVLDFMKRYGAKP